MAMTISGILASFMALLGYVRQAQFCLNLTGISLLSTGGEMKDSQKLIDIHNPPPLLNANVCSSAAVFTPLDQEFKVSRR